MRSTLLLPLFLSEVPHEPLRTLTVNLRRERGEDRGRKQRGTGLFLAQSLTFTKESGILRNV